MRAAPVGGAPLLGLALALAGCESTGVGNPGPQSATLELALAVDAEPEPDAADPDAVLTGSIERAFLVLGAVRWLPCDAAIAPVEQVGPYILDLVASRIDPPIPPVVVPEAGFCGLEAPLVPATQPLSLAGRSLFFAGTRPDGTRFLVYTSATAMLRATAEPGVSWTQDESPLLWALRPRRWVAEAELDTAPASTLTDGTRFVVIDAERRPALFLALLSRLAGSSTLHHDQNGNHRLDPAERTGPAWVGRGLERID